MKIIAKKWHISMLAVMVANIFQSAPQWAICLALGSNAYYSLKELVS